MRRRDTFVRRPICLQWMPGWHCPCGRCLRRSVQSNRKLWILQLSQWVEIKTVLASCKCHDAFAGFSLLAIGSWGSNTISDGTVAKSFLSRWTHLRGEKLSQKMSNMKGRKLVFGECRHRFSFNSDASAPNALCKLLCNCIALHCTTTLHNGQGGTFTTAVQAGEWLKVCGELARHCTESSSADKLFYLFFTLHHLQPIVMTLLVLLLGPSLYTTFSQTSGRLTPVNVGPE